MQNYLSKLGIRLMLRPRYPDYSRAEPHPLFGLTIYWLNSRYKLTTYNIYVKNHSPSGIMQNRFLKYLKNMVSEAYVGPYQTYMVDFFLMEMSNLHHRCLKDAFNR